MHLSGQHNTGFQLSIVGYEFPQIKQEWLDSDWLEIEIRVTAPRGNWSSTDPILLTWEVAQLADWLETVASGRPADADISFVEPNLRFKLMDQPASNPTIRVYFEQESRPPWDPSRFGFTDVDVASIDLHLTADALQQAAIDLRTQLQQFPIRVGRPVHTPGQDHNSSSALVRTGWNTAFRSMAANGDDQLLDGDREPSTTWDEDKWAW